MFDGWVDSCSVRSVCPGCTFHVAVTAHRIAVASRPALSTGPVPWESRQAGGALLPHLFTLTGRLAPPKHRSTWSAERPTARLDRLPARLLRGRTGEREDPAKRMELHRRGWRWCRSSLDVPDYLMTCTVILPSVSFWSIRAAPRASRCTSAGRTTAPSGSVANSKLGRCLRPFLPRRRNPYKSLGSRKKEKKLQRALTAVFFSGKKLDRRE